MKLICHVIVAFSIASTLLAANAHGQDKVDIDKFIAKFRESYRVQLPVPMGFRPLPDGATISIFGTSEVNEPRSENIYFEIDKGGIDANGWYVAHCEALRGWASVDLWLCTYNKIGAPGFLLQR